MEVLGTILNITAGFLAGLTLGLAVQLIFMAGNNGRQ